MADQYQNGAYQPYNGQAQSQPSYTAQQPYRAPPAQYPPQYAQPYVDPTTQVMSIGSYLGVFFISVIPLVNIICWIVWLASPNTNKNKKNYIIATIIYSVIVSVVTGIIVGILIALGVVTGSELLNF